MKKLILPILVLSAGILFKANSQVTEEENDPDVIATGCKYTGTPDDRCSHGGYSVTKCVKGATSCGYNIP
ncbi:hypothetical protein FQZ97_789350 [compost metagenome]